jgi:uncharacterized protein (DUF169 family)
MARSVIAEQLKLAYSPVAISFRNEKPEGALGFAPGRRGCVISLLTAAAKGRAAAVSQETCGCTGGLVGLGFGKEIYDTMPGGIEHFLSTGRGPGHPEGEHYWKTPEFARSFVDSLPDLKIPGQFVIFRPLDEVDLQADPPELIVFYANPDQLSALVVLTNYGRPAGEHVMVRMASGCQSIGILPYAESRKDTPRAVLGMFDISARPSVDPNVLTFAVPFRMYQELEADVPGSFLEHESWAKVRARIPEAPK